jgi:hypothetical protein
MGYIANDNIIIDAILTKKGRELLSRQDGSFQITQYSLSDDEIDYTMYNPNHPSGSAFFGEAIEHMPILEAIPDETQIMKYKLVTLSRGTSKLPVINVGYSAISLKQGASITITPQTLNYLGAVSTFEPSGYVITVNDNRLLSTFSATGIDTTGLSVNGIQTSGTNLSISQIGTSFTLVGTTINTLFGTTKSSINTTMLVQGRDSGASITIPLTITKNQ